MAKKQFVVCDKCLNPLRPTLRYTVIGPSNRASMDLCEEHAAPLAEFLKVTKTGSGRSFTASKITPEQLEQLKAEGKA